MGMFDYVYYQGKTYQTKDTPTQLLDEYEIRGAELWYNNVKEEWVESSDDLFGGHLEPISSEWERVTDFDGAIKLLGDDKDYIAVFWKSRMIGIRELGT